MYRINLRAETIAAVHAMGEAVDGHGAWRTIELDAIPEIGGTWCVGRTVSPRTTTESFGFVRLADNHDAWVMARLREEAKRESVRARLEAEALIRKAEAIDALVASWGDDTQG